MTGEAWAAVAAIVGSISAALSAVAVGRTNATNRTATQARDTASEARELARPTGNGYANESRAAWARIERQIEQLAERQVRTNGWILQHLTDHAQGDIQHSNRHDREEPQ